MPNYFILLACNQFRKLNRMDKYDKRLKQVVKSQQYLSDTGQLDRAAHLAAIASMMTKLFRAISYRHVFEQTSTIVHQPHVKMEDGAKIW